MPFAGFSAAAPPPSTSRAAAAPPADGAAQAASAARPCAALPREALPGGAPPAGEAADGGSSRVEKDLRQMAIGGRDRTPPGEQWPGPLRGDRSDEGPPGHLAVGGTQEGWPAPLVTPKVCALARKLLEYQVSLDSLCRSLVQGRPRPLHDALAGFCGCCSSQLRS